MKFTVTRLCSTCRKVFEYPLADGWIALRGVWACPECAELEEALNVRTVIQNPNDANQAVAWYEFGPRYFTVITNGQERAVSRARVRQLLRLWGLSSWVEVMPK